MGDILGKGLWLLTVPDLMSSSTGRLIPHLDPNFMYMLYNCLLVFLEIEGPSFYVFFGSRRK